MMSSPQRRNSIHRKRIQLAYRVPFVDPREHHRRYGEGIDRAIRECLTQGDLIMRRQLKTFEENFARFIGTKYAVGLNSGYHALAFSVLAAGLGPGDEVITVAHTFAATVSAIVHAGATPKLIDVGPDYNMDMVALERAITPRTRAVIPVHLNGRVCDMERLNSTAKKHDLLVIEDAAQAVGATFRKQKAGSFGLTGCFSFYPFKLLGGFGDGGAITTNDPKVARAITLMRYNGEDRETGEFHYHGQTALLDNVQAAVLDFKLTHVPKWIEHRCEIARQYRKGLGSVAEIVLPHFAGDQYEDVYQNYVIRTARRDELRASLKETGIETLVSWPKPMWHHPGLKLGDYHLAQTEAICREVISLPISAETTQQHVEETVACIRRFFGR
jgi:dTDP-4-amino-4,6-dideoxygalactose transaminase